MLPPKDPANTANVRIFMASGEAPFAGHPNVGTGAVLAWKGELFGKPIGDTMTFEEIAGLVEITVIKDAAGNPVGSTLVAPQTFQRGCEKRLSFAPFCTKHDHFTKTGSGQT